MDSRWPASVCFVSVESDLGWLGMDRGVNLACGDASGRSQGHFFVNQFTAINIKSSKTQFQFPVELSLAQLSPSLLNIQQT